MYDISLYRKVAKKQRKFCRPFIHFSRTLSVPAPFPAKKSDRRKIIERTHRSVTMKYTVFVHTPAGCVRKNMEFPPGASLPCLRQGRPFDFKQLITKNKPRCKSIGVYFRGDPYGNRTHVTAVKGRCLNRLTNGPGSGDLTRTGDRPGMNRVLYQLSYAAMWSTVISFPKSASLVYIRIPVLSSIFSDFFKEFLGTLPER